MSAALRIQGEAFDVKRFRSQSSLEVSGVYERGFPRPPYNDKTKLNEKSSVNIVISEADFYDFPQQVLDAIDFLKLNFDQLRNLPSFGVTERVLDFGIANKNSMSQTERLPLELIHLVAELEIEIEVSHYLVVEKP